jgi:20S proteasome alpha/beta subunit
VRFIPVLSLIIGVHFLFDDQTPLLFQVGSDGSVHKTTRSVIGMGDAVARSYLEILHTDQLSLDLMRPLALFVLYQAKKSGHSGGSTHVYTLPRRPVKTFWDESKIADLSERAMRTCMVTARDTSIPSKVFESIAEQLKRDIVAIRDSIDSHVELEKWTNEMMTPQKPDDPVQS